VTVRVLRDGAGELVVVPAGDGPLTPVARLSVPRPDDEDEDEDDVARPVEDPWDAGLQEQFGREWRGEQPFSTDTWWTAPTPEPAVLVGRLHDRGIVALLTEQGLEVPLSPLRLLGSDEPLPGPVDDDELDDEDLPGVPMGVDPAMVVPSLPVVARPPLRHRALGVGMLVASLIAVPAFLLVGPSEFQFRFLAVVIGGQLVVAGTGRALQQLVVTREALDVVGRGSRYLVPWERLHGVRREGGVLSLAWEPDVTLVAGPFERGELADSEARADHLGRLMMTLREGALAAGPARREVTNRFGPVWLTMPAYAAVVGGALLRLLAS
jgi:hypothetical protein